MATVRVEESSESSSRCRKREAVFMLKWDVEILQLPAQQREVSACPAEAVKDVTEEPSPDDEKRRNYGGVYVGLPADLTTVAASQSKSSRKD
nr:overexpressed in colon carcinoma 1 protein isoform X3 [Misgurnus anguillicaudatus]